MKFIEETDFNAIAAAGKLGTKARGKAHKRAVEAMGGGGAATTAESAEAHSKKQKKDNGAHEFVGADADSDEDFSFHDHSFTKDLPGEKAIKAYFKVTSCFRIRFFKQIRPMHGSYGGAERMMRTGSLTRLRDGRFACLAGRVNVFVDSSLFPFGCVDQVNRAN